MAETRSHIYHSQEINDALRVRVPRPSVDATIALVASLGVGIVATGLETVTGIYNYSREHRVGQRFVGRLRNLGNQALSVLGEFSGPNDGVCLTDSSTSMGYVVVQEAAVPPIPQTQRDTGEVV